MHTSILSCLNNIENLSLKYVTLRKKIVLTVKLSINYFEPATLQLHLFKRGHVHCNKNVSCIIDGGMDCYNTPDSFCCLFRLTGKKQRVLNLGSYNYLGFSQNEGPCADAVEDIVNKYGVGTCASRQEMGTAWFFKDSLWSPIKIQGYMFVFNPKQQSKK